MFNIPTNKIVHKVQTFENTSNCISLSNSLCREKHIAENTLYMIYMLQNERRQHHKLCRILHKTISLDHVCI